MARTILTEGELNEIELCFDQVDKRSREVAADMPPDTREHFAPMLDHIKSRRAEILATLREEINRPQTHVHIGDWRRERFNQRKDAWVHDYRGRRLSLVSRKDGFEGFIDGVPTILAPEGLEARDQAVLDLQGLVDYRINTKPW